MKDFDKELRNYQQQLQDRHYPHSDATLDKEIRRALWSEQRETLPPAKTAVRRMWLWPAIAASILAIVIPVGLHTHSDNDLKMVDIDGQQLYFACNNGCSLESTLESFNTLLR